MGDKNFPQRINTARKNLYKKVVKNTMSSPAGVRRTMNIWGPNLLSGTRWTHVSDDYSYGRVELKLRPWNRNLHGVAYGGTLYAMGDAIVGVLTERRLGNRYEAWTRVGSFQYLSPGRQGCYLEVNLDDYLINWIKKTIEEDGYCNVPITLTVYNRDGNVVGISQQDLHVRPRGGGERAAQPKQALFPRGPVLESLATALVWHEFRERPEILTRLMSEQRRIADPRDQMRHVVKVCLENGSTKEDILDFGVPEKFFHPPKTHPENQGKNPGKNQADQKYES
ncbi:PaaI family thioesterase [Corynebacterium sp. S7]